MVQINGSPCLSDIDVASANISWISGIGSLGGLTNKACTGITTDKNIESINSKRLILDVFTLFLAMT
jgi:hypothetical protein